MLFGAISGSGQATFAAVGSIMIPAMEEQGYDKRFVTGVTASSGGLGVLIPPSLPMVMYAISIGTVSIGSMLTAGILPGILCGVCLMVYCYIYCKRHPIHVNESQKTMGILRSIKEGFWALLTPVIILGGIYGGIFTATEAAAAACVYALIVSLFIYRTVSLKELPKILLRAAGLNAPILIIVSAATVLGRVLTLQNVPEMLASAILSLTDNRWLILLLLNVLLLIVGMLMETLSAITILAPILLPVAVGIGLSPIHFGVMMVANLAIGFITPPVGTNLYTAASITGIPVKDLCRHIIGPVIALLVAQVFITLIEPISTFLPSLIA
jgi:C4-dicarboxylate transporter DctM subunit